MINSFNDFYNNLSSNGLFFFWIVVFLFVFVIFLLGILLLKNRKLSKYLKENNVWIYGTDMETEKMYYDEDLTGNVAIVIGSEGFGMSRLVKENCDFLIKIHIKKKITSLNASVSAGIVMYEAVKQRMK